MSKIWSAVVGFVIIGNMPKLTHEEALEAVYTGRLNRADGYSEIPTSLFVDKIDVNMGGLPAIAFFQRDKDGKVEQLKAADQPYSLLALSIHDSIWVRDEDVVQLKRYSESLILKSYSSNKALPPEKRMSVLRRSAILVVEDLFKNPSAENLNRSSKMVGSFVYVLMKDPKAYMLLTQLSSHDPYTLQHSVGTAVNSIILARKMGVTDEQALLDVGLAGLLHDIGKVKVRKEIINKQGPLDELEWEEMRQHSKEGWEIVKDNPQIGELTKRAIREHHEDKNGTGYPDGKKYEDVHLFSKIVCLCDIFNALTTDRTYSKARPVFDAFKFIREKMMHKVDEDIFRELVLIYGGKLDEL